MQFQVMRLRSNRSGAPLPWFFMPLFSFRTQNIGRASASDACELEGHDEAWEELTRVCGDLIAGNCRELTQTSEWSVEVRDATDVPLFRIRLVAEALV
jgi:hypothetical protein